MAGRMRAARPACAADAGHVADVTACAAPREATDVLDFACADIQDIPHRGGTSVAAGSGRAQVRAAAWPFLRDRDPCRGAGRSGARVGDGFRRHLCRVRAAVPAARSPLSQRGAGARESDQRGTCALDLAATGPGVAPVEPRDRPRDLHVGLLLRWRRGSFRGQRLDTFAASHHVRTQLQPIENHERMLAGMAGRARISRRGVALQQKVR